MRWLLILNRQRIFMSNNTQNSERTQKALIKGFPLYQYDSSYLVEARGSQYNVKSVSTETSQ